MKVLHLPYGIGMSTLSQALRNLGVDSTSCNLKSNRYSFAADIQLPVGKYPPQRANEIRERFLEVALNDYDIFHFHFGETFFPDKRDLKILKNHGKKLVVHHRGSEVRTLSIAQSFNNPYVKVKDPWKDEKKIRINLQKLSTYIDHAIVNDYELLSYVEPYYKKVHILPHAIETNKLQPCYRAEHSKPLIVHAPTHKEIKGSAYVVAALEQLQKDGFHFDFHLIEGLPHNEAIELYRKASIIVDQLQIGAYGHLSVEAMAMGKPVVCFVRDDLRDKYPADLPIVSATPDTIYPVLQALLNSPGQWKSLGERGRNYVRHYHDIDIVARQLLHIYSEL